MKLATFNINGIRSHLPAPLAWLEKEQPDIACLQELQAPDAAFPVAEIEQAATETAPPAGDRRCRAVGA